MKTQPIGPFLGINNRLPDFALHIRDKGDYLADAENVDVDNAGRLRRREADISLQAMTGAHSLFETYIVRDAVMYRVMSFSPYSEAFFCLLTSNDPVSWLREGDDVFFSNGVDSGRISAGVLYPLGLPTPSAPGVSATAGDLYDGAFQVAVSYTNVATGEESGVSPSSNITLATYGGLAVDLPPAVAGATHVNVYVSTVNGSVPLWRAVYSVGTATATFSTLSLPGREAPKRFEAALPAGRLFMSNGRLCSFKGNMVYVGLPYRYGYYDVVAGWIPFPGDVSVAVENQHGTYVAADKTYWIPGDLADVQEKIVTVLPYGAVLGTEFRVPYDTRVGWFSAKGIVTAGTAGDVSTRMAENVDVGEVPAAGAAVVRNTRGYYRVTACGWCMNLESGAVTRYTNYEFTSLFGEYGTKADGVYALTGGTTVDAKMRLGKQNFGVEELKSMPATYLGVTSDYPMALQVQWPVRDSLRDFTYPARNSGAETRIQRIDPGRGAQANWFDLTVYNQEGSDFTLASVSFAPVASSRRI